MKVKKLFEDEPIYMDDYYDKQTKKNIEDRKIGMQKQLEHYRKLKADATSSDEKRRYESEINTLLQRIHREKMR
jgi:hypothetical protein